MSRDDTMKCLDVSGIEAGIKLATDPLRAAPPSGKLDQYQWFNLVFNTYSKEANYQAVENLITKFEAITDDNAKCLSTIKSGPNQSTTMCNSVAYDDLISNFDKLDRLTTQYLPLIKRVYQQVIRYMILYSQVCQKDATKVDKFKAYLAKLSELIAPCPTCPTCPTCPVAPPCPKPSNSGYMSMIAILSLIIVGLLAILIWQRKGK